MKLIIGLGNPGKEYEKTRHNVGFRAIDALRENVKASPWKLEKKFEAEIAKGSEGNFLLVKPQTFMNLSGKAVAALANFYKVAPENILVVFDDIDLLFGTIRFREKGSSAGHNGIKSLITSLGSSDFPRIKIGINQPERKAPTESFVLQKFSAEEQKALPEIIDQAIQKIMQWIINDSKKNPA